MSAAHGYAVCIREPRGDHGLEGYMRGDEYRYERRPADKRGKPYVRIWLVSDDERYDTCGPVEFARHFQPTPEVRP